MARTDRKRMIPWAIVLSIVAVMGVVACGYHLAVRRDGIHLIPEPRTNASSSDGERRDTD